MKSKRFLAMLLSIAMLISSWSLFVLADGDGSPDGDISSGDTEEPGNSLYALKLDEIYEKPGLAYGSTYAVTFTPDKDGEYTIIAGNVSDAVITVTDGNGTVVPPVSSQNYNWTYDINLRLSAGKTYTITVKGGSFDLEKPFALCMVRTAKSLSLGRSTFFARGQKSTYISFTPDVSGVYRFTESHHSFESDPWVSFTMSQGISVGDNAYIADLTAGETYSISVYCSGEASLGAIVNVDITREDQVLSEGRTNVTVPASSGYTAYAFTPSKTGVYVFSSEGEYSTRINVIKESALGTNGCDKSAESGAGGNNFLLPVALEANEKYLVVVNGYSEGTSDITFPVTVKYEEPKGTGTYESPAEKGYLAYYAFRAEESGYYMFLCPQVEVTVDTYLGNTFINGDQRVFYVEKGQDIVLSYFRNEYSSPVSFTILPLEKTLLLGENTLTKEINKHIYAKFTPEVSGTYTITMPESEYNSPALMGPDRYSVSTMNHVYYEKDYTYSLTGGVTYVLVINLQNNDSVSDVTLKLEKTPSSMLGMGKNTMKLEKAFSFTPKKSGTYQFYDNAHSELNLYHGSNYLGGVTNGDYDTGFSTTAVKLTALEEYTIKPQYYYDYNEESIDIFVKEIAELSTGENTVSKAGMYTETTFVPDETGIYLITCEGGSLSNLYRLYGTSYSDVYESFEEKGVNYALLEKGCEYVLELKNDPANTSDTILVNIEKERVLTMGRNEDVLVKQSEAYSTIYTYYSFIPEKSGTYTFRTENGDNVNAFIYEKTDKKNEVSRGYVSWTTYNMTMTATLEAGHLYHVQMCIENPTQQTQDALADLIIEQTPAEKLDGYSISLDGTIAVNLYLSLADFVAESKTAVLHCTFPNGKEIDYKMHDADIKTMNNQKYYVFHLPVAAKEMSMIIYAQIIDEANEITGEKYSVSIDEYARYLMGYAYDSKGNVLNKEFAAAVPLVKALLNYGARAQKYFEYKYDNAPANWMLSSEEKELPDLKAESIPSYVLSEQSEKLPDGLTFDGASISIVSETEMNLYFTNKTGKKVVYSEPGRGIATEGRKSDGSTIVKITGIPAHKLDEVIRVEVSVEGDPNTYFVTYSPIFYCHNVIARKTTATRTENLKELMTAFYFYNQAAKNYHGE